jgi:hypothetical protein
VGGVEGDGDGALQAARMLSNPTIDKVMRIFANIAKILQIYHASLTMPSTEKFHPVPAV